MNEANPQHITIRRSHGWPSEIRLAQAMEEYLQAIETGDRPARDQFLARYEDIAPALAEALDGLDFLDQVVPELALPDNSTESSHPRLSDRRLALGDFRLVREIGRGGMGVVYEAEQLSLGRRVAVKVLPFAALLDKRQLERFKNEARAAAMLKHPNIVSVYSIGCQRGLHFYAMEMIEGPEPGPSNRGNAECRVAAADHVQTPSPPNTPPLQSNVHSRKPSGGPPECGFHPDERASGGDLPSRSECGGHPDQRGSHAVDTSPFAALSTHRLHDRRAFYRDVARIGSQIARALHYAHEHGVIHRDVKPSNLLIEHDGTPRVTDFGLAQIQDDQGLTLSGEVIGTLRYMSPEQFRGAATVDQTTDIYSLGLTLYELATGRVAFSAPDRQSLMDQVVNTMPHRPGQIDRRFPRDLETILLKCSAKDRGDRYATAAELADDLDRFTRDEPIRARPPRATEHLSRWARRNRALAAWMAVALALLVVLAIAGPLVAVRHAILAGREHAANERLREENYIVSIVLAYKAGDDGNLPLVKKLLSGHIPHASEPDLRGFEWHHLWGRLAQSESVPALKHAAVLKCADISPDGTLIASGCADGSVHLWDRQHQSLIHSYAGHADQLKAILFLPESNLVVSGTLRETIVWNVVDSVQRATLSVTGHELAVSPDGRWLVTSYQKPSEIAVLEARSLSSGAQPQFVFSDHSDDVSGLAFVDDGQTLVSSSHDGTVKLWDLADGRLITTLTGHTDQIDSVACAPGIIASGGDDGNIILQQRCGLYLHAPESQVRRL